MCRYNHRKWQLQPDTVSVQNLPLWSSKEKKEKKILLRSAQMESKWNASHKIKVATFPSVLRVAWTKFDTWILLRPANTWANLVTPNVQMQNVIYPSKTCRYTSCFPGISKKQISSLQPSHLTTTIKRQSMLLVEINAFWKWLLSSVIIWSPYLTHSLHVYQWFQAKYQVMSLFLNISSQWPYS